MPNVKVVSLVVVDDDPVQLEGLKLSLKGKKGITLVSSYSDPVKAFGELEAAKPDVLLTDISMPGMSGIELIRMAREKMPDLEIMALTVHDDLPTVFEAIKAGATGYLLKTLTGDELIESIMEVGNGGAPMSPSIARSIILDLQKGSAEDDVILVMKEKDVLGQVVQGFSYKEISERLNMSVHTVHWYVKNIYKKLHAKNRKELLIKAKEKGIL